jgi:3-keto-disaccharide hydrolase
MTGIKLAVACLLTGLVGLLPGSVRADDAERDRQPNTLTEREQKSGWKLLFDGKSTDGWRAFRDKGIPDVWKVVDGALVCSPNNGKHAGDIVTDAKYGNFELAFEWKVSVGANSGVMYRVSESEDKPWKTGPEYQVLDNAKHSDGRKPKTSAASCYALYAPTADRTKPVGEWNHARIVVDGHRVEHWLNGQKVVEFELGSPDWEKHVAASKFRVFPKFGKEDSGHIDLQFHGDEACFRSIRIRPMEDKK